MDKIKLNGKDFTYNFPNTGRVNKVSKLCGLDVYQDAEKMETDPMYCVKKLEKPEDILSVVKIIFREEVTAGDIESITPIELNRAVVGFFIQMFSINQNQQSAVKPSANT